jgi:hypothetical protein
MASIKQPGPADSIVCRAFTRCGILLYLYVFIVVYAPTASILRNMDVMGRNVIHN